MRTKRRPSVALITAIVTVLLLGLVPLPAEATPGLAYGNYAWYNPGTTATNGLLKTYVG